MGTTLFLRLSVKKKETKKKQVPFGAQKGKKIMGEKITGFKRLLKHAGEAYRRVKSQGKLITVSEYQKRTQNNSLYDSN